MRRFPVLFVLLFVVACRSVPQPLPIYPELSTLRVCDLIKDSSTHHNMLVRVRGTVVSGFETFALSDSSCPSDNTLAGMIWLDTTEDAPLEYADNVPAREYALAGVRGTLPSFLASQRFYPVIPVRPVRDESWSRLHSILQRSGSATATVVGRFEYSPSSMLRRSSDGRIGSFAGFGHLNGFSRRIVIERIEQPICN